MSVHRTIPITKADIGRLRKCVVTLVGRLLVCVRYRGPEGTRWPDGNAAGAVDTVDQDVIMVFDAATVCDIAWAMDGRVSGIDMCLEVPDWPSLAESDVSNTGGWRPL